MRLLPYVLLLAANAENGDLAELAQEAYMHVRYKYELHRASMPRNGEGQLWLDFGIHPRVRLQGVAHSPKFGEGTITVEADHAVRTMYVRMQLQDLHMDQCLKYPFPAGTGVVEQKRLQTLRARHRNITEQLHDTDHDYSTGKVTALLPWTERYRLGLITKHDSEKLLGVTLRQGKRVVKRVDFLETDRTAEMPTLDYQTCMRPQEYKQLVGRVDLTPPHQRSSALNDLLLMLSGSEPLKEWGEKTLLIQSFLLPGDIAVMLEDPDPPKIEQWHHISFDYSAATSAHGHVSHSRGTMWIDMENRAFRLNGNAENTKVGALHIDLLVHAQVNPAVYANIVLKDESEQECMRFNYPTLTDDPREELEQSSKQPLQFFSISEIDNEDCGIFLAPLARGLWLHLWVDLESDNPHAFLRSEIHRNGKVLRSTKVETWRAGEDVRVKVQPKEAWHCGQPSEKFASLDVRSMHHKSIQLEDALFSLHELSPDFAVRELLGLTGDLAVVVKVPAPPQLSLVRAATFNYQMNLDAGDEDVEGNFALDAVKGRLRMSATDKKGIQVTLAVDVGQAVAVKVQKPGRPPKCLKMALAEEHSSLSTLGIGIFQKVQAVGDQECNHFTYTAQGDVQSLDLWYSEEENAICQIDLTRSLASDPLRITFSSYIDSFMPDVVAFSDFEGDQADWSCPSTSARPWLHHDDHLLADSAAPTSEAVGAVTEALGLLGIVPGEASALISSLSWDEALSLRTSSNGMALKRKDHAPPCCLRQGLEEDGRSSPLVREIDGELHCTGLDAKTEQEWVDDYAEEALDPHSTLQGVCLSDGYYAQEEPLKGVDAVADDVMSPLLKTFGFSFESVHPIKGYAERPSTGEVWRHRHRSSGELRVDLENRRLYMRSTTTDFSKGIAEMVSEIIYRGDRHTLWARSLLDDYEQCFTIDTSGALPARDAAKNPFRRGRPSGQGAVPDADAQAQKYTFFLPPQKRVDFYVDEEHALSYLELRDLSRDVATGVSTKSWVTAPLSDEIFEVRDSWECEQHLPDSYLDQLATWDLIQVFLPQ